MHLHSMTPCEGVKIEDMGMKFDCNGVDNGKFLLTILAGKLSICDPTIAGLTI